MKHLPIIRLILSLFVFICATPTFVQAADLIDHSSDIFKFQQKLANKGNMHAQYKLGTMYEIGDGVKQDQQQASHWYEQAVISGSETASWRKNYLEVKQRGYDEAKDGAWLKNVKSAADQEKPEAVYLLAELYQQGIGVEKDLQRSLVLYKHIRSSGIANIGKKVAEVNSGMVEQKRAKAKAEQAARIAEANRQREIEREKASKQQKVLATKQAEALSKAEKRKKYEAIMRKLQEEQKLIDEQQRSVSGDAVATVDDEI